ncbi:uncharacterized protein C8A04DRAFT_11298 [Dichotomopilus funicola]|uniref:HTH La-type RNA-binding domain-containing protein n=1 Tax=Dichotomopilus funicola TaxID=1934379 RepID=A0AAN6V559_9PEZI|nr:hypothetical protein C8A04DRAFT_11298 [Dichotomopilus funicola]
MSAATFSYAQAARGRTISQPTPQETSSPAPSTTGSQVKDDASTGATSGTAPSVVSTAPDIRDTEHLGSTSAEAGLKQDSEIASVAGSHSSAPFPAEPSSKTANEAGTTPADSQRRAQSQGEEKASRPASRTSRVNDSTEGRKGRKGKKGRGSDKDAPNEQQQEEEAEKAKEPPKPVILTEAPLPTVNPWAKRIEARGAMVSASADAVSKQSTSLEAATPRDATNGINGDKSAHKKSVETSRPTDQASRRNGPRGSRATDKDDKTSAALPPAADPSSWPDPKSAAVRDQLSRKVSEKTDAAEKDSLDEAGPTRKKTWEKLDIVHSVVFETQLPQLRGNKPRSSAPRGGREGGSMRGNNHSNAAAGTTPQPAAGSASDKASPAQSASGPKPTATRPREGSVATRTGTQSQPPHTSKRAPTDGASREQRKAPVLGNPADQSRDIGLDASSSSKRASATRDIRLENGSLNLENGQSGTRSLPQERNNFQRGEYLKDGTHGQSYPARDGRPDRGRGGSYRSRGNHSNSQHIPSGSYAPNGHYPATNGFQSRQNSNTHSPPPFSGQFPASFGQPSRGRGNKWTGSNQPNNRNNAGATGFPPKAAPANDYAVGQYPPYMYSPIFDASVPILKSQIEYYLSVENLCKDYYLRQHMDGQGFVHLATIASFKRIKAVTEDVELVRLACSLSDSIEFGVGDDNIERLRTREKWQHFVLPAAERAEPYRNDGPATWTPYAKPETQFAAPYPGPVIPPPYHTPASASYPAFSDDQIYAPSFVNGGAYDHSINGGAVNGHHQGNHETPLSAGVPEYAPPQSPITLENMTNLPDSQLGRLTVVLSLDDKTNSASPDVADIAGYVLGSVGSPEAPSVNGNHSVATDPVESAIVWLDDQAAVLSQDQRQLKTYNEIYKEALEKRRATKAGESVREMQRLYKFWSHLLLNEFNAGIYEEFRDLAFSDASQQPASKTGLKNLLGFYDKLLLKTNTQKPWPQDRAVPEIFTAHLNEAVELDGRTGVKSETSN